LILLDHESFMFGFGAQQDRQTAFESQTGPNMALAVSTQSMIM